MTTFADREVPPPPTSMRDLLAACAAATAVSTPPTPAAVTPVTPVTAVPRPEAVPERRAS
ncbi:hypothetical protein ACFYW1_22940 [Streptomyces sp. NPDC002669]|uniref:hypothetical protein n=1 Tax=Streptomyces sp. NPDC002669 TaxID=3364658 RepID=UPI0036C37568